MTYHDDQPEYRLTWPDEHELAGLEVRCRATTLAAMLAVLRYDRRLAEGRALDVCVLELADAFVEHVAGWDLMSGGRLVPVEVGAFLMLDRDVVIGPLLRQWRALVLDPPRAQPVVAAEPIEDDGQVPAVELDLVATTLTKPGEDWERVSGERPQDPGPPWGDEHVGDGYGIAFAAV